MLQNNTTFKKFEELTEQEKKDAYLLAQISIYDTFVSGFDKPSYIKSNIGKIKKFTGLSKASIQEAYNLIYSTCMRIGFSDEWTEVGFNASKKS